MTYTSIHKWTHATQEHTRPTRRLCLLIVRLLVAWWMLVCLSSINAWCLWTTCSVNGCSVPPSSGFTTCSVGLLIHFAYTQLPWTGIPNQPVWTANISDSHGFLHFHIHHGSRSFLRFLVSWRLRNLRFTLSFASGGRDLRASNRATEVDNINHFSSLHGLVYYVTVSTMRRAFLTYSQCSLALL